MTHPDQPLLVYQGPPRWNGNGWENGDRFTLSGPGKGDNGIELAGAVTGLDRGAEEYRYDAGADTPGSLLTSIVAGRREILAGINILGDNPRELRINKNRWERNHQDNQPGRLYIFTPEGHPRYLEAYRAETAGTSSLDKDPHLRSLYEDWDWGWTADNPYFFGYEEVRTLASMDSYSNRYEASFFNPSTAPHVYPKVLLYGPGRFHVPAGYGQPLIELPDITAGQIVRVDYNPENPTVLFKPSARTPAQNWWYQLGGRRPVMSLEPETDVTFTVRNLNGRTPNKEPELIYTPLFRSWV